MGTFHRSRWSSCSWSARCPEARVCRRGPMTSLLSRMQQRNMYRRVTPCSATVVRPQHMSKQHQQSGFKRWLFEVRQGRPCGLHWDWLCESRHEKENLLHLLVQQNLPHSFTNNRVRSLSCHHGFRKRQRSASLYLVMFSQILAPRQGLLNQLHPRPGAAPFGQGYPRSRVRTLHESLQIQAPQLARQ